MQRGVNAASIFDKFKAVNDARTLAQGDPAPLPPKL